VDKEKQPRTTRRRRLRWIAVLVALFGGLWYLVTDAYREEEKELRTQLREAVKERFPDESAAFSRSFGLFRFEPDREASNEGPAERGTVVLVHGLDDPGKVWRSLAPELRDSGLEVWLFQYPNDQPIVASVTFNPVSLRRSRSSSID